MQEFKLEEYHRNIPDQDFLEDIKSSASKLGKTSLSMDEYLTHGKYHPSTVVKRFGSWTVALQLSGLILRKNHNIPEEELYKNLEEVWIRLGRQPHHKDMKESYSKYAPKTYENRFGTWRNALESFIIYINANDLNENAALMAAGNENSSSIFMNNHKTGRSVNFRLRFVIMHRDNFKCKICGRSPATDPKVILHVDHIKAWSKGGETLPENLQTLCSVCNIGKSDLTV
jgi:hypothetical protein